MVGDGTLWKTLIRKIISSLLLRNIDNLSIYQKNFMIDVFSVIIGK